MSCLSLVPQHRYTSKRWADHPSLSFCSSRCLSDMLWLQLSRVKRSELKKKAPRDLWSPLLFEAVQLKQDVWSQCMPAILIAVWFSKLTVNVCWDAEPKAGEDSAPSTGDLNGRKVREMLSMVKRMKQMLYPIFKSPSDSKWFLFIVTTACLTYTFYSF